MVSFVACTVYEECMSALHGLVKFVCLFASKPTRLGFFLRKYERGPNFAIDEFCIDEAGSVTAERARQGPLRASIYNL